MRRPFATSWGGGRILDNALATSGIIVFRVDPRSASGKGAQSAWACYKQLGVQELKDLEEAVAWLCKNPYADAKRVGISGHSYGGFMAAFALTHSRTFSAGIASGPVTDWKLTTPSTPSAYMLTPKENADGYARSSCVAAAKNLHGQVADRSRHDGRQRPHAEQRATGRRSCNARARSSR